MSGLINNKIMRTKFIKKTNKQYSIREDGVIISHKRSGDKILKASSRGIVTLSVNNIKTSVFTSYLIKQYFNYFICSSCGKKASGNTKKQSLCKDCKITVKESNIKYYSNLSDEAKLKRQIYKTKSIKIMDRSYLNSVMRTHNIVLSDELYNAKRQQLLLHRQLKQINL